MGELRYAILQTDSVLEQFQPQHGDYPGMFADLLMDAGVAREAITNVDVRASGLPDPAAHDAYVITGSRLSVYDDEPWIPRLAEFVGAAMLARRAVVGICFGHQLLAHFFGGRVEAAEVGWAVGVHSNRLLRQEDWMQPPLTRFDLISSHKDQVCNLPPDAQRLAETPMCPNAAFTLGDYGLAIQGHPEFGAGYARSLLEHRRELLGERLYLQAVESLSGPLDSATVAHWMVAFVRSRQALA